MEIATANTPQITPASAATPAPSAGQMISSDFETFLKMLTVQMQNQDPMNPIESTDYAVQLATFSGVEQQVKTNDLLSALGKQLGAMGMTDLAGWVGMEARAAAPVWFDNRPISLHPEPASGAQRTVLVVRDSAGAERDRIELPVSDQPVEWAGVDAFGQPFSPGLYSFSLLSLSQGEVIGEDPVAAYSEIVEARVEEGETILVLNGGAEVRAGDVGSLRAPREAE
ncbi:flagellar hook capping FlgD N-terminal domain-containing protein [Maritimibacter fusiformis]|uniref:Basal-body rod modification protein FlgD n=1 Tax=Maritimibacter fusiformis TaxID=2603819 RepID=A0A5D0R8C7_9RHOB|nr:flagellar hook capping FlgD N-terminal domain-containing protein [Maritimibacter fusiformis]TYB77910.1 flagellar basal body rod modification protein [Maritimibacter fusiformis]